MKKDKKYMVEYLNIDEHIYIENDEVKIRLVEGESPRECSWEEMRDGVMEIINKVREYDESRNKNCIQYL